VQLIPIEEGVFPHKSARKKVEALPSGRASDKKESSPKKEK
jgi:hypothetical protein